MRTQMKVTGKGKKCAELGKPKCWEGAKGRHQSYDSQKFEAREVKWERRSHLPEMLAFFIVIISPNLFDLRFLSLS